MSEAPAVAVAPAPQESAAEKVFVDSHFVMGSTHSICQDYAINAGNVALLCDGCSLIFDDTGRTKENPLTDVGARLLAHSAVSLLADPEMDIRLAGSPAIQLASGAQRMMKIPSYSLSATLMVVRETEDQFTAACWGDGMIAARSRDSGEWFTSLIEFTPSPRYLAHELHGYDVSHIESNYGDEYPVVRCFGKHNYDTVVVMSDGCTSFRGPTGPCDVIDRLLDFRSMRGRFVFRQLRGVLRELAREGIYNTDDLSCAGATVCD